MFDTPGSKARLRASRACEACRTRRVKCSGSSPCTACQAYGEPEGCQFRAKSRPNRSRAKNNVAIDRSSTPESPGGIHRPIGGRSPSRPMAFIEDAAKQWAAANGVDPTIVMFHDSSRIVKQPTFYRDPAQEADLMSTYLSTTPHHLDVNDREKARALFPRFAALPSSLSGHQQAFIYACLCMAADMQRDDHWTGQAADRFKMENLATGYFHLACETVGLWSGPSMLTLSALQYLITFAAARGSKMQTVPLLQKMAWQIHQLGLCQKQTAALYPPTDQVDILLTAVIYMDSMCATLLDQPPQILASELNWDPSAGAHDMIATTMLDVMRLEADFLDASVKLDFQSDLVLILDTESKWTSFLKSINKDHTTEKEGVRHSFLGWALIRVHILSIMLRAPLLYHEKLGSSSLSIVARSSAVILRVYWDLSFLRMLQPCWIQLRRIVTCIQLVIITSAEGHLHPSEAKDLLSIGIDLVRKHDSVSDTAGQMAASFQAARDKLLFGVPLPSSSSPDQTVSAGANPGMQDMGQDLDWPSIFAGLTETIGPGPDNQFLVAEDPFSLLDGARM